jgi:hypothetical protein
MRKKRKKLRRCPGRHEGIGHGLHFYELRRIRKAMRFIRQQLDIQEPVRVDKCLVDITSMDEVNEAIRRVCRTRSLRAEIIGRLIIFEPQTVQTGP